jgi:hypothetical protein
LVKDTICSDFEASERRRKGQDSAQRTTAKSTNKLPLSGHERKMIHGVIGSQVANMSFSGSKRAA